MTTTITHCRYCGQVISEDGQGAWIDVTGGDCCSGDDDLNNENGVHTPNADHVRVFPLPGDTLDHRTVIASTWLNDDPGQPALALVMLLNRRSPYYTVTQITENEAHADGWDIVDPTDHLNINEATECYADSGGDI